MGAAPLAGGRPDRVRLGRVGPQENALGLQAPARRRARCRERRRGELARERRLACGQDSARPGALRHVVRHGAEAQPALGGLGSPGPGVEQREGEVDGPPLTVRETGPARRAELVMEPAPCGLGTALDEERPSDRRDAQGPRGRVVDERPPAPGHGAHVLRIRRHAGSRVDEEPRRPGEARLAVVARSRLPLRLVGGEVVGRLHREVRDCGEEGEARAEGPSPTGAWLVSRSTRPCTPRMVGGRSATSVAR